ncbi:MAG: hypothetical protein ACRDHL_06760 [Candidatus Promineifilaceae bacterium]
MLRVFTASHCPGHARTRLLVAALARRLPGLALELVDLDAADAEQPAFVVGTPTFVWGNQVLFLGNPAEGELLARLAQLGVSPHESCERARSR